MNLAWLAAVLAPRHISSGPYQSDHEDENRPARLAAVVLGRHLPEPSDNEGLGNDVLSLAEKCFRSDTIAVSVADLGRVLVDSPPEDLAESTALALIFSAAASELDDYEHVFRILDNQISRLDHVKSADATLLTSALGQQKALRLRDAGLPFVAESMRSGSTLLRVTVENCSNFPVRSEVSRSSTVTVEQMCSDLLDSAVSLLPHGNSGATELLDRARAVSWANRSLAKPRARLAEQRASAYARHVEQRFADDFRTGNIIVFGSTKPDLFHELLMLELLGHGAVYAARKELGLLRIVQNFGDIADTTDSLRLLRQAGAKKELDLVLQRLRDAGPLSVLSYDARQVIRSRLSPEKLRNVELSVLEASADILAPAEAAVALEAVIAGLSADGPPDSPGRRQAFALRKESAWRAAAALGNACGRTNEVALLLLEEAERQRESEELWDGALAKALRTLEWTSVSLAAKRKWEVLTSSRYKALPATIEVVARQIERDPRESQSKSAMDQLIFKLNTALRSGVQDSSLATEGAPLARELMSQIRAAAVRGQYSMGGIHPADIAASLITISGAVELWLELTDFLLDARVQRDDRTPGFERLARLTPRLPAEIQARFASQLPTLLESPGVGFFEPQTIPYPAALRFSAVYGLISEADVYDQISRLAGSPKVHDRLEAALTISLLSANADLAELVTITLPLARDGDARVRASAGRALASFANTENRLSGVALRRLTDLLSTDGIVTPLLALRALVDNQTASEGLPEALINSILSLSKNHPSRLIRIEADKVLAVHSAK